MLLGNTEIKEILKRSKDRVGSAYLFTGPAGVGKKLFAINFAKLVNCLEPTSDLEPCEACSSCKKINSKNHPDYLFIEAEKSKIKISQIRDAIRFISYKKFEGKFRVVIIDNAHEMNVQSQNALLKSLEEPTPDTVFILITSNLLKLLPTIKSRCQRIRFKKPSLDEIKKYINSLKQYKEKELDLIAKVSGKSFANITKFNLESYNNARKEILDFLYKLKDSPYIVFHDNNFDFKEKENLLDILDFMLLWFRDVLFYKEGMDQSYLYNQDIASSIEKYSNLENDTNKLIAKLERLIRLKNDLINTNINAELAFTDMMMNL